jgi:MFS family permease
MPARQSFLPSLVKKEDLPNAVSIFSIFFQIATITGPAVAGILIAKSNVGYVYAINSVSYLIVLLGLFFVRGSGEIMGEKVKISVGSILEGLSFIRTRTMIWSTMLLDFFSTFFSGATALLPIFAKDILHVGPIGLGMLYAAQSIGALIAGIAIAHQHEIRRQGVVLLTSVGFYAAGTIIFGLSKVFLISFIALIILGAGDGISTIIRNTIRQLETPDYIRGRMSSINVIFFMGGPQLGDFEAGWLASAIGAPASVVLGGIGTLAVIGVMAAKIPKLRNYDRHEEIPII